MEVIGLLKSKNRCLARFLEATRVFLAEAEEGRFDGLERFEIARASALKAAALFDGKIEQAVAAIPPIGRTRELSAIVEKLIEEKDRIVETTIRTDQNVMMLIERERQRLLKELGAHRKASEVMNRFKSEWLPKQGEELDQKL